MCPLNAGMCRGLPNRIELLHSSALDLEFNSNQTEALSAGRLDRLCSFNEDGPIGHVGKCPLKGTWALRSGQSSRESRAGGAQIKPLYIRFFFVLCSLSLLLSGPTPLCDFSSQLRNITQKLELRLPWSCCAFKQLLP